MDTVVVKEDLLDFEGDLKASMEMPGVSICNRYDS